MVEAYGEAVPLEQVAQVSLRQGSTLVVTPFDPSVSAPRVHARQSQPPALVPPQLVGAIEHGIRVSDLGLNPSLDGSAVRVPVPKTTKESRAATAKALGKVEEAGKVRLRRVRQWGLDRLRRWAKGDGVSSDAVRALEEEVEGVVKQAGAALAAAAAARRKEVVGE